MRKMIQGMLLSASALAFVVAPATITPVFAQDTAAATPAAGQCDVAERDKLYNEKFYTNYSSKLPLEQQKIAYEAGKEYVAKYSNCGDNKAQVDFINGWIPKYVEREKNARFAEKAEAFNAALKNKNTADVFRIGKEIIAERPDFMSVNLYIVDAGYQSAQKKVTTYNAETAALAKQLINEINSGKAPAENNWAPFKDKEDTLAWLNYTAGFIAHSTNKKEAAPYFYKTVQYNSPLKSSYFPYLFIAEMYLEEYTKAAQEFEKNKENTDLELVKKLSGTYKAYADRAMEAYAKAYNVAKAEKKDDVAKAIYDNELTQFYKLRNNGETKGLTEFVAAQSSKTLTDPATPVTPVVETTPSTASTSAITSSAASDSGPAKAEATAATAKPAAKGTAKAAPAKKAAAKKGRN
jgi:hypothetical protein